MQMACVQGFYLWKALMRHEFLFHLLATKNKNNKEKGKRKVKYQLSEHACRLLKLKKKIVFKGQ